MNRFKLLAKAARTGRVAFVAWRYRFGYWEAVLSLLAAAKQALHAALVYRKDNPLAAARLETCDTCPFEWHGHCGRPGEFMSESDDQAGCWCVLELAAQLPKKKCFARNHGYDFGWIK